MGENWNHQDYMRWVEQGRVFAQAGQWDAYREHLVAGYKGRGA